jgi:PncC family amidohydrolase
MGGEPLAELVGRLQAACLATGTTVALAESCTGGLVAAALTDRAGSSGYVAGGIVSYSNEAKRDLLGVDPDVLVAHGAVSAQVARAMAIGARARFGATIAGSVTGIAGPDGGSEAKPVGLTYLAVADVAGVEVRRIVWAGDRAANRQDSVTALVGLLLERVEAAEGPGRRPEPVGATAGAAAGAGDGGSPTSRPQGG